MNNLRLVNNTGTDIRGCVEDAIWAAIKSAVALGSPANIILPEEIADLFSVTQTGTAIWMVAFKE